MKSQLDVIREKLRPMMGKQFKTPTGAIVKFISFEVRTNDDIVIDTDNGKITKQVSEVEYYLVTLRTVDNLPALSAIQQIQHYQEQVNHIVPLGELSDILMDSIRKVSKNPEYIDQARTINDQAKTVVDIMKVRVEALKTLKDMQS